LTHGAPHAAIEPLLKAFRRAAQFAHGFRPQGKGLDLAQETASVLMEAIEGFQARRSGRAAGHL
jgi:ribosomal protein S12 methylthiotransferase accessory factor YcaO